MSQILMNAVETTSTLSFDTRSAGKQSRVPRGITAECAENAEMTIDSNETTETSVLQRCEGEYVVL
jgi:hypothetical protein